MTDRIAALEKLRAKNPADARILFALALEYEKLERWEDVVLALREYLGRTDDEGNAWGRLANALHRLGRDAESRDALVRGVHAARSHGHPGMAGEFEELLEERGPPA